MCGLVDRTLGALAEKCHAFAKALHYKEQEFVICPETAVEALISINNQLRQPEAAVGVLTVAQKNLSMDLKVPPEPTPRTAIRNGSRLKVLCVEQYNSDIFEFVLATDFLHVFTMPSSEVKPVNGQWSPAA